MTEVKGSILGNAVLRREDPTLLTGEDKYFDDMEINGLGFVYFARSPVAHANIISIETADAKAIDGVVDVWTADDLDLAPYLGFPMFPPHFARPPLAKEKVRLVGDIIAVVVADSFSAAADGAAAIWMDYEPLPAVTDPEKALKEAILRDISPSQILLIAEKLSLMLLKKSLWKERNQTLIYLYTHH